ncbi:hypothetical protein V6N00_13790 [Tersicoccus sp. MR15.9]|uniref:hypothetical protein n=1 Tax=Tersicoccus mangrovi TaxID=3121635 RepID=UPI002FE64EB5
MSLTPPQQPAVPATGTTPATTGTEATAPAPLPPLPATLTFDTLPQWGMDDYGPDLAGSAALKLADSGVAPLVAAARGYTRMDAENFTPTAKAIGLKLTTKQGKHLKDTIGRGGRDAMVMPWYAIANVQAAHRNGTALEAITHQLRPELPRLNDHDKPVKYEFLSQAVTPLDVHPSTPVSWIDGAPTVMIAEGMLKGDSALSAYLRHNGVSWDDLSLAGVTDARAKLTTLLEAIPEEHRVTIVNIAGINNDKQNPADWREIDVRHRIAWIAFDADLGTNPHVHRAAVTLSKYLEQRQVSQVLYLNPQMTGGEGGQMAKAGVDDFLAKAGTWSDLVAMITPVMPDAPVRDKSEKPGNWRITKDGTGVEECSVQTDSNGIVVGYTWTPVMDLGGRVVALETVRQPTDKEIRTGHFDPNVTPQDIEDAQVEIEISWDDEGDTRTATVTGPETILHFTPAEWVRQGATVPRDLLLHPAWPPRAAAGEKWLAAIKAHRPHDRDFRTKWMQMSWVPVEGGDPVFLIGDQVIGDMLTSTASCGVDDRKVPVAQHYGVGELTEGDYDDEAYRQQVREDLQAVIDAYLNNGAWTETSAAAVVLGTALRPVIPLRPRTSVMLHGPKGAGKSWSAEAMMKFWERRKGVWQGRLPGQAKDTAAAIENAVAYTPIWVIDDMAPSASKRQAEDEDKKLSDITRAIFNNAGKNRMNADMTSRRTNKPMAQLVMTAENQLITASAKERLIPVYIGPGKLSADRAATDRIVHMAYRDGTQARLTQHLIKYVRHAAASAPGGWEGLVTQLIETRDQVKAAAATMMERMGASTGSLERTTTLASDLLITFELLSMLAQELDMDHDFVRQFGLKSGIGKEVVKLITSTHAQNQQAAPGISLIRAISALLSSGGGHIVSGDAPLAAPMVGTDDAETLANTQLGWMPSSSGDSTMRPSGPKIGTMVIHRDAAGKNRRIVLFDVQTAFNRAQSAYPALIPFGQSASAGWASVWDEKLAAAELSRVVKDGNQLVTARVRVGQSRVSGVPVDVDLLLNGGPIEADGEEEYSSLAA